MVVAGGGATGGGTQQPITASDGTSARASDSIAPSTVERNGTARLPFRYSIPLKRARLRRQGTTWTPIRGNLPAGLAFDAANGRIYGTPVEQESRSRS